MTTRRGGRTAKAGGQREPLLTRLPVTDAEHYRVLAERAGLSVSSWIALQLAQATQREVPDFVAEELRKAEAEKTQAVRRQPELFTAMAQAS